MRFSTHPRVFEKEVPEGHGQDFHLDVVAEGGEPLPKKLLLRVANDDEAMLEDDPIQGMFEIDISPKGSSTTEGSFDGLLKFSRDLIPDLQICTIDGDVLYTVPIIEGKKATPAPSRPRSAAPIPRPQGIAIGGAGKGPTIGMPVPAPAVSARPAPRAAEAPEPPKLEARPLAVGSFPEPPKDATPAVTPLPSGRTAPPRPARPPEPSPPNSSTPLPLGDRDVQAITDQDDDEEATSARSRPPPPLMMGNTDPDRAVTLRPGPPLLEPPASAQRTPSIVAAETATEPPTPARAEAAAPVQPLPRSMPPVAQTKRRRWVVPAIVGAGGMTVLVIIGLVAINGLSDVDTEVAGTATEPAVAQVDVQPVAPNPEPPTATEPPAPTVVDPTPPAPEPTTAAVDGAAVEGNPAEQPAPAPAIPDPPAPVATATNAGTTENAAATETDIAPTRCTFADRDKTTKAPVKATAAGVEGQYVLRCREGLFAAGTSTLVTTGGSARWSHKDFTRLNENYEPDGDH